MSPVESLLTLSLAELQNRFSRGEAVQNPELLKALEADPRAGARALARRLLQKTKKDEMESQRLQRLLKF